MSAPSETAQSETSISEIPTAVPATLILIGAPQIDVEAPALKAALAGPAQKIVLLESDPDLAATLDETYAERSGLKVIAAAVASKGGKAEMVSYNQPGLRSLRAPSPYLQQIFPGLKPRRKTEIRRITVKQMLQQAGKLVGPVHLWIDAGGEEADILTALQQLDGMALVEKITLRCGVKPLFEGAAPLAELTAGLRLAGFMPAPGGESGSDQDPDWPETCFVRDPLIVQLQAELTARTAGEQAAKRKITALTKKLEGAEAKVAVAEDQLALSRTQLQDQAKAQEAQVKVQKEQSKAQESAHAEALAELQAQLEAATQKCGELETDLANQLADQKAAHKQEQDRLTRERDAAKARSVELQGLLTERTDRVKVLAASLETAQANLTDTLAEVQKTKQQLEQQRTTAQAHAQEQQDVLAQRTDRIKALNVELQELRREVSGLTDMREEQERRQGVARDELRRAEGQIEILKDLMLREAGL